MWWLKTAQGSSALISLAIFCRYLRPSMLQQLLHRLVFDVPLLTDYCKMPLRVGNTFVTLLKSLCCHVFLFWLHVLFTQKVLSGWSLHVYMLLQQFITLSAWWRAAISIFTNSTLNIWILFVLSVKDACGSFGWAPVYSEFMLHACPWTSYLVMRVSCPSSLSVSSSC